MFICAPPSIPLVMYRGNSPVRRFESIRELVRTTRLNTLVNAYLSRVPWNETECVRFKFEGAIEMVPKKVILSWITQRIGGAAGRKEQAQLGQHLLDTKLGYLVPFRKPKTRKSRGGYGEFRLPSTMAEKRMNSLTLSEEGEPPGRACRNPMYLPSSWDDIPRDTPRNWKSFRRTQWA